MAKISGILTDGAGQVINDCTIELYAKKTTSKVLTQTQAFKVANNGSYTMNVLPCEYDVSLIINGFPKKRLGTIQVYSDSVDGSLNDYLLNPTEEEITPAILQQVFEARNETNKSANRAVESEKKIKISENNAVEASKLAKTSADNAKSSEEEASKTATAVKNSVDDAKKYAEQSAGGANNAKTSADNAKNSADLANQSATNAKNLAQQSADNAIATKSSADAAKTSEQSAKKSADDAKNAVSSIDTSVFIKKSSVDNQSINGSLDVKNLTENGQRVYSPNNKPTPDDIGTMPAIKKELSGAPIYVVGNSIDFAIKPKIAGIEPIYIVESYVNGDSWYNKYSNGFIEQSGVIIARTPNANAVCGNLINLLTPMKTGNYGVSVDKVNNGLWGDIEYAYAELYLTSFWLASYSHTTGEAWIRWTVRGY